MKRVAWLLLSAVLSGSPSIGQTAHQHSAESPAPPTSDQLGEIDFPNSGKPEAQADFIRGVKLLHNFQYDDAVEAFQAAQKADPEFALAYWGEAMSHNYSLWSEQQYDDARKALTKLAPTPAGRAAKAKTPREREYLAAVEALYGEGTKFERDIAFADKMDALAKTYPDDVEAQAFDALATLGRSHGTRDTANYEKAGAMLEPLFARYPNHPGIVHYIIHSYDDPNHAARGLAAAKVYDKLAPDSAHAQHMTSHIFLALGMWPDVERANIQARAAIERGAGKPLPKMACGHGGIWLVYARLQQGLPVDENLAECRNATLAAIASGEAPVTLVGSGEGFSGSVADMTVRQGVETGKWDPAPSLPDGKLNYARFIFAYGDVLASRSEPARAADALGRMKAAHAILTSNYRKDFPDDDQTMQWMDLILAQADALNLLIAGRKADGLAGLEAVAKREAALPSAFGPPFMLKPTWELLGDERLAAGDKAGAAAAYQTSLKLQPGRRLSLAGLANAGK
jgi:tetratricopeptide (TPR) repeat protein